MGSGMLIPLLELIAWPGAGRSLASPWLAAYGIAAAVTGPFTVWLLYATRRKPPITTDRPPNQFGPPPRSGALPRKKVQAGQEVRIDR